MSVRIWGGKKMLLINVAIALVTLISSAQAGEQKATAQTDTAPIETPRYRARNRYCLTLLVTTLQC